MYTEDDPELVVATSNCRAFAVRLVAVTFTRTSGGTVDVLSIGLCPDVPGVSTGSDRQQAAMKEIFARPIVLLLLVSRCGSGSKTGSVKTA